LRNQDKYTIDNVKELLLKDNIILLETKYTDVKTKMLCLDKDGYYVYIVLNNYLHRNGIGRRFDKSNNYSIININHYLKLNNVCFECISDKFESANKDLVFKCTRCNELILAPWRNVNKNDNMNRSHVICKNCDGKLESLHALILKQMFLHYYSDTSVEDKTYRSLITNKICPTDIVNHRLKIAVEIQSRWHDFEDIKMKDVMKKDFWISKGYKFYALDIRDYSILEMCQVFFDIDCLPEWINYEYSSKLNIKKSQDLLNKGLSVVEVAECMNVDKHRIYDAIYSNKLYYPQNYKNVKLIKNRNNISQESSETTGCIW
jgi:transcription elongation factor Elf1